MEERMRVLDSFLPAIFPKRPRRVKQLTKKKVALGFWVSLLICLFLALVGQARAEDFDVYAGAYDTQLCGNGIVEGTEECDDNNLEEGDGCSSWCQSECLEGATKLTKNKFTKEIFASIDNAVNASNAFDFDVIQITDADFDEDIFYVRDIILTLSGGYHCNFSGNSSKSKINSLTISKGTVIVENLIIKSELLSVAEGISCYDYNTASNPGVFKMCDIGADDAWSFIHDYTAENVLVAVIDSGFNTTHSELFPIITEARNFIGFTGANGVEGAVYTEGHGTAMASLIVSVN